MPGINEDIDKFFQTIKKNKKNKEFNAMDYVEHNIPQVLEPISKKEIQKQNKQRDIDMSNQDNINALVKMDILSLEEKEWLEHGEQLKKGTLSLKQKLMSPTMKKKVNYHVNVLAKQMGLNESDKKHWYWTIMREELELAKKSKKIRFNIEKEKGRALL